MEMLSSKYPFMSAYLKGQESKLVTQDHIDRLLRAKDVPETIEILKGTDIGDYLDTVLVTNFDEADRALWLYLRECLRRIAWFDQVPPAMQKLIDAYMAKYDVLNIKAALEAVSSGKKASFIALGSINILGWLEELGNVTDIDGIKNVLKGCGLSDYAVVVEGYKTIRTPNQRLAIEAALDRQYYADLLKAARDVPDHTELIRAIGTMIDIRNLKILMRGVVRGRGEEAIYANVGRGYTLTEDKIKELGASRLEDFPTRVPYEYQKLTQEVVTNYGRNKNITAVGDIADRHEFGLMHDNLALKLMSPAEIVWYLILKETEIRNLRLILRALFDNVSLEEIKGYLVMTV